MVGLHCTSSWRPELRQFDSPCQRTCPVYGSCSQQALLRSLETLEYDLTYAAAFSGEELPVPHRARTPSTSASQLCYVVGHPPKSHDSASWRSILVLSNSHTQLQLR